MSALLDEDAFAGALLGGLDYSIFQFAGHRGHTGGTTRLVLYVGAVLDIGQSVVEQREYRRRDLLAKTVSRAEILVDPDLHQVSLLHVSR